MTATTTDPIADMLARIRNALAAGHNEISLPHSNIKEAVAVILDENNFLCGVEVIGSKVHKSLSITLNGGETSKRITAIKRLSTPGRRQYVVSNQIPSVKRGRGLVILSTSHGLMTGNEAKERGIGGELICEVY